MVKATLLNEEVHGFLVEFKEGKVDQLLWQYVQITNGQKKHCGQ